MIPCASTRGTDIVKVLGTLSVRRHKGPSGKLVAVVSVFRGSSPNPCQAMAQAQTPLTMAGRELMRNRIISQSEAEDLAVGKPGEDLPVWLESTDWRLKLGAASALSLKGAPQLAGAPEIRAALESSDESARQLIRRTLAASAEAAEAGAIGEDKRVLQLLQSDDWRLRKGALDALQRQEAPSSDLTPAVADICVCDPHAEVRAAARGALKRYACEEVAAALSASLSTATASQDMRPNTDLRVAEDLLLELLGSAESALSKVPGSAYFADLVQQAQQKAHEVARWQQEQEEKERELQDQQNELQKMQLQWLDLLPDKQITEIEHSRQALESTSRHEAQALKRRARRRMRDSLAFAAEVNAGSGSVSQKQPGLHDFWVEQSAARLKEAEDMSLLPREDLLEQSPKLLEWMADKNTDGISSHLKRVAAELTGKLETLAKPEHHRALCLLTTAHDARLRTLAVQALGRLRSIDSAADVAKLLADSDPSVRKAAGAALASLGLNMGNGAQAAASAVAHAAQQLCSTDADARKVAERTLLDFKVSNGEESHKEGVLRLQALIPHLEPLLQSELADTRCAVASVIHRLRKQAEPVRSLTDASASAAPEAVLAWLSVLDDPCEETRVAAMRKLKEEQALSLTEPSAVKLARSLGDASEAVRKMAVEVVGALRGPSAAAASEVVTELLQHKLQCVRRAAAATMERLGTESAAQHLALLADEDPTLRCNATEALSKPEVLKQLGDKDLTFLLSLSIDPHWAVRLAVAKCLCALSPDCLQKHYKHAVLLAADADWRVMRCARKAVNVDEVKTVKR